MALLPLAGFAAALPSDLQVTFADLTYSGTAQTPTISGVQSTTASGITTNDVNIAGVYADQACTNPMTDNKVKNAGTYYVKVKGHGANYDDTVLNKVFTLTVAKYGDIKVSAKALYKVYGDEYPDAGFFVATMPTSAPNGETAADAGLVVTPSFNSWETTKEAGVHQFTISVNTVTNYNVVVEVNAANLTINKRDLIVKAKDVTKSYGVNPRSDFGVTYGTTLVEGDETTFGDVTYTIKNATTQVVITDDLPAQGIYTITPSLAENANYNFTYETGTLTIGQRSLQDENLTFNVTIPAMTYSGNANKVKPTIVDAGLNKTLAEVANEAGDYILTYHTSVANATSNTAAADDDLKNAGTYYVKISGQNNYTGSIVRSYTVNQKSLWITSKNDSTTYTGTAISVENTNLAKYALFEGLVANDATNGLPKANTYKGYGTANVASILIKMKQKEGNTEYDLSDDTKRPVDAGEYKVLFAPSTSDNTAIFTNYKIVYIESGIHKIKPAELKFTVSQTLSKNNGETNVLDNGYTPTATDKDTYFTAIATLVNGQVITTYPKLVLGTKNADDTYPVNVDFKNIVIKASNANDAATINKANYDLKFVAGLYTINKGQMAVRPINVTATYGDEEQELSVYAYGGSAEDNEAVAAFLQPALEIAEKGYPFNANGTVNTTATAEQMVTYPAAGQYFISFNTENVDAETLATWKEKYNFEYFNESTYTINKKAITIKLNQQSLMVGEGASNLEANKNTVEFTGLIEGDKAEDLYDNIDFAFDTEVLTSTYYNGGALTFDAAGYHAGNNPNGFFANAITLAATTVFANYKYTAATDITKGDLYVSVNGGTLALDEKEVTNTTAGTISAKDRLTAANNYKYNTVTVKLYRKQTIGTTKFSWNAQQFNALVLPFDVTLEELASQFGYAIVNVVNAKKSSENNVYWSLTWETIPANTPFVVRTIGDIDGTNGKMLTFSKKVISYEAAPSVGAGYGHKVVGTYAPVMITKNDNELKKFLANGEQQFITSTSNNTWNVAPFDAYFDYTQSENAREVTLTFEDLNGGTTSIAPAELTRQAVHSAEGWYTIDGIKLQNMPTEKGVYIQNGKKVVIK